jgi:uncharacterized membrane protein
MDFTQSVNLNTAANHPLFDPTFLNLDYLFNQILRFLQGLFGFAFSPELILLIEIILALLSLFFIFVIIYCTMRIFEIREKEHHYLEHEIAEYAHKKAEQAKAMVSETGEIKNGRWENVLNYLASPNASDWKLAVIEADSMLEDLTDQLELQGENLGERLKAANKEKFETLDNAWEAHIVRNRIAHEGSKFELTQREANRVAVLYENVFREFSII